MYALEVVLVCIALGSVWAVRNQRRWHEARRVWVRHELEMANARLPFTAG